MPGIKHKVSSVPSDGETIISAVELVESDVELPPVEPYVTISTEDVLTPRGLVAHEVRRWSKRGLTRWLAACPKVPVYVPLEADLGEVDPKKARPLPVYYDGYRIDVPKGRNVMVAKPIADIIEQSQQPFRTAQAQGIDLYRIDPDNPNDRGLEIPSMAGVAG